MEATNESSLSRRERIDRYHLRVGRCRDDGVGQCEGRAQHGSAMWSHFPDKAGGISLVIREERSWAHIGVARLLRSK